MEMDRSLNRGEDRERGMTMTRVKETMLREMYSESDYRE